MKGPQTEALLYGIENLILVRQLSDRLVEIRIVAPAPEARLFHFELQAIGRSDAGLDVNLACFPRDDPAFSIAQLHGQDAPRRDLASIGHMRRHVDECFLVRHRALQPRYARRSVIDRREADLIGHQQMDGTVEAAEHAEVAGQGRDVGLGRIANADRKDVFAVWPERIGDFIAERAERTAVLPELVTVEKHIRHRACCLEPKEVALALLALQIEATTIPAGSAVIIL